MLKTIITSLALCSLTVTSQAQDEDTLPVGAVLERQVTASPTVESFRPVGEYRVWRFYAKQQTFGQLTSLAKERVEIDGTEGLTLETSLRVDYSQIGAGEELVASGETYVSQSGHYLGSKLSMGDAAADQELEVERDNGRLKGFFTRGDQEQDISLPYGRDYFFWETQFVDQLEIYLGMQDLRIGGLLDDSIYLPQSLFWSHLKGEVIYFMWQEIYKGKIDSVFVIRLTEPGEYQLYFTPEKELVRVDMINQGVRIYQDLIRQIKAPAGSASQADPGLSLRGLFFKLPHYFAYLALVSLAILFFSRSGFRWWASYAGFGLGLGLYFLVPLVQDHLVTVLFSGWLARYTTGSGLMLAGTVPSLLIGFFQTGLLLGGLVVLYRLLNIREYRLIALGAFLAGGFAIAEAVHTSGMSVTTLFNRALLAHSLSLVFFVSAGALLGYALSARGDRFWVAAAVVATAGSLLRYLPLMVPGGFVASEVAYFVSALVTLGFLATTLLWIRAGDKRGRSSGEAKTV